MCTDTYPAGIVVKELKLLEKHLPRDGKYAGVTYNVSWSDYESGAPITNQMLANKLNFGVMGDYPLVVNGAKFQETASLRTVLVSGTAYNKKGSGNAIVVPVSSNIHSIEDLRGRSVSTPVGSAAWGMLVKALGDAKIPMSAIELKNQSPTVGAANIAAKKIDAHADFCPWSEIMQFRGTGRVIYDGSETGVPYLHGVVVRKDFAEKYPEVVVAFIKAIYDAERWIESDPVQATQMMEKWTGVEKEVLYLYFSKGGYLTLDPTLKSDWVDTLKFDHKRARRCEPCSETRPQSVDRRQLHQAGLRRDEARLRSPESRDGRPRHGQSRITERDLALTRWHREICDRQGIPRSRRQVPGFRSEAEFHLRL